MEFIFAKICDSSTGGPVDPVNIPKICADDSTIQNILLIVFAIIGALVLFYFIIAGLKYTVSKGEPDAIEKAKNEMKYAIIGMVIVGVAAVVVKFAVGRLKSG